ncbi:DUF6455 family protein [Roseovarius sp. 2305UL8-3]|uniref:DUF6455 family protein n=1 Tax=Roseovarius conchicola TaxID=3121636 RepID=UPI003528C5AE
MNAEIRFLGDPARHFWLTRSVARTMGISLSEAMAMGYLSAPDYAKLVNTCRTCPNASQCEAWLGERRAALPEAPDHCMNCATFARLAKDLAH